MPCQYWHDQFFGKRIGRPLFAQELARNTLSLHGLWLG
jgi:hypothetical protein